MVKAAGGILAIQILKVLKDVVLIGVLDTGINAGIQLDPIRILAGCLE